MAIHSITSLVLLGTLAVAAHAQPVIQNGSLTDPAGRTLYVFDKDAAHTSHCSGPCLQAWPAYTAEAQPGAAVSPKATRFQRDGAMQWAWNGKPLYYFVGDAKPGDRAGDGSGGVWHIVTPAATAASSPTASHTPGSY